VGEHNRAEYLSLIRLEIQAKANLVGRLSESRLQEHRSDRKFKIGDVVLLRLSDKHISGLARWLGSAKIVPKWSLPYRVVRVSNGGLTAMVRSIVSGAQELSSLREVHIQNARFISPPLTEVQRQQWDSLIQSYAEYSVLDPAVRNRELSINWEPFREALSLPAREGKRPRPSV